MKSTTIIIAAAVAVIVGVAAFMGGTYYQRQQFVTGGPFGMVRGGNMTPEMQSQMQRWRSQGGGSGGGMGRQDVPGGGFGGMHGDRIMSGRLDKKDGNKLTLTTRFGSMKVTVDSATKIKKTESVKATDLKIGKELIIQGVMDEDGQLTAKSVIE